MLTVQWQKAWAACQMCWAPQAICHTCEAAHDHRPMQYKRQRGGQWQYCRVLCEVVTAIMQHASEDVVVWIDEEAVKAGFKTEHGMKEYLGSVVQHRGVEMGGMC